MHGGHRKNSGRPRIRKDPKVVGFFLDEHARNQLDQLVDRTGLGRSELITHLIKAALIEVGPKPTVVGSAEGPSAP